MRPLPYFKERSVVDASGCWNWRLYAFPNGYGGFSMQVNGRTLTKSTHRGAWEAVHGPISKGAVVCHRCDNRLCCNPDHLFIGTQSDNIKDMVAKGRGRAPRGEAHHACKLTSRDVSIIKLMIWLGVHQKHMVELFGLSQQSVSDIWRGKRWAHVLPAHMPEALS